MKIINLETKNTSYSMGVTENNFLLHLYYGEKVSSNMDYLITYYDRGFSGNPYESQDDRSFSLDTLPQEYPSYGNGDFRTSAINMKNSKGVFSCDLRYKKHKVYNSKYSLIGLPAVYSIDDKATTTEIILEDKVLGVEVILKYGVIFNEDVITRSVEIKNIGIEEIIVDKAFSSSIDFLQSNFEVIHFPGRYGMERNMERVPLNFGKLSYTSKRGTSSHQENPFFILANNETTEDFGDCYGFSFIYSGNFKFEVEKDQLAQTRVLMGINDELFEYILGVKETLVLPEVAISYSDKGLTGLSQIYHKLIRNNICRGSYKGVRPPILINNWEATYFDFNGYRIIDIAKKALEVGIEMVVMDDGWFGKRNSDSSSLGDWVVNEEKLGGSLKSIVDKINNLGLKFGIWIEPEMVSEDSQLYKEHPDFVFKIPNKKPIVSRSQYVLDFSRSEVVDYIFNKISKVIESANIEYIKMDMNRSLHDIYTKSEAYQNAGTIMHKYILGVYNFLERLINKYPNILIEGCSGGGGRFDAGMLYYTQQIWCSDNTDAIERIIIQHGTSFGYPISSVGSHVSAVPNHQTERVVNIETRGIVAMAGTFGYELDLNIISKEDKDTIKKQIQTYKKHWNLIYNGLYYRLHIPSKDREVASWLFVSEDKKEALLNVVSLNTHCNNTVNYIKLKGLNPKMNYKIDGFKRVYSGVALMKGGIPIPVKYSEYSSWQIYVKSVQ